MKRIILTTAITLVAFSTLGSLLFRPDLSEPRREDVVDLFASFHSLPIPWIEPIDVSNAVAFLVSPRARYVTGVMLAVDGGLSAR